MTERGPRTGIGGTPNPADPSHPGDAPAPPPSPRPPSARPPTVVPPTVASSVVVSPTVDLSAVRGTDALVEALAARCAAGPVRPADDTDPAVRLLHALITDVDDQTADPAPPAPSGPGPRRRGSRTIVALGVAGAVLASTGVAAAGGGVTGHPSAAPAPRPSGITEQAAQPAADDVEAATHDRARPPVRPAPEPVTARKPSRDPERADIERLKRRLEHLFPPRHHRGRPDGPAMTTKSAPAPRPEAAEPGAAPPDAASPEEALRRLDALRREAEKRARTYQEPRWDD
ncbi:hypothetical protein ABZ806_12145 [Spirillospora sp. NPDC047418]